jgi:hypothetical protein
MTTTCNPFGSVKVSGGSEVSVLWAKALVVKRTSATNSEAAKRWGDIMTYQKARTEVSGSKPPHPIRCGSQGRVTKLREGAI